jgi:hypothetical protein
MPSHPFLGELRDAATEKSGQVLPVHPRNLQRGYVTRRKFIEIKQRPICGRRRPDLDLVASRQKPLYLVEERSLSTPGRQVMPYGNLHFTNLQCRLWTERSSSKRRFGSPKAVDLRFPRYRSERPWASPVRLSRPRLGGKGFRWARESENSPSVWSQHLVTARNVRWVVLARVGSTRS